MKRKKLFCFGFGQVAQSFVKKISSEKISIELTATSREKTSEKIFENIIKVSLNRHFQNLIEFSSKSK